MEHTQLFDKIAKEIDSKIADLESEILNGACSTELKYRQLVERRYAYIQVRDDVKNIFSRAGMDED